ncbi:hypothetical protein [Pseudoruegeria sp. HB172150]|uniref:hypothetical protein n=1 Tax=Pseudoruegeria sp. HB172150 TaxID=2721164 RepID=UPI0015570723|nr:hypothetical protein [Pseudoruegeria sp. HB172150]
MPGAFRRDLMNVAIAVNNEEALETACPVAHKEGIRGGIVSGANLFAALKRASDTVSEKSVLNAKARRDEHPGA